MMRHLSCMMWHYNVWCGIYHVWWGIIMYDVEFIMYDVAFIMYDVAFIMYDVEFIMYDVQFILYVVAFTMIMYYAGLTIKYYAEFIINYMWVYEQGLCGVYHAKIISATIFVWYFDKVGPSPTWDTNQTLSQSQSITNGRWQDQTLQVGQPTWPDQCFIGCYLSASMLTLGIDHNYGGEGGMFCDGKKKSCPLRTNRKFSLPPSNAWKYFTAWSCNNIDVHFWGRTAPPHEPSKPPLISLKYFTPLPPSISIPLPAGHNCWQLPYWQVLLWAEYNSYTMMIMIISALVYRLMGSNFVISYGRYERSVCSRLHYTLDMAWHLWCTLLHTDMPTTLRLGTNYQRGCFVVVLSNRKQIYWWAPPTF